MAVVTIICVVAAFLLPGLTKAKRKAVEARIMNGNRQTNLLYLIEADPNDDYFPFADGGTTLKRGKNPGAASGTNIQ